MPICVNIADRLYDYSDEERASEAVAQFQHEMKLDDVAVISLWQDDSDPHRSDLEKAIFDAVDRNGTVKRARESIPAGVSLHITDNEATA